MASKTVAPTVVPRRTRVVSSQETVAAGADQAPVRSRGRSRSDTSRTAILHAALKLLEIGSVQQLSIEAIAREAGVGKATIYRWWPSKASVVIDAFVQYHVVHTPMPRDVSPSEALRRHLQMLIEQYSGRSGRLVAQILAEGQGDPEVLRELRERFFYGRRELVREIVEQARKAGEFRTDISTDAMMDLMYGPIYFRLLMAHLPLDRQFAEEHNQAVFTLLSAEKNSPAVKPRKRA
ncbi:TetR/AcrR family transcriptional regulator [Aquabacterium sp.]|uniref:TetR/AcrR family transcriptional regulator n=1 Tax=Aquabacterium sp. TaxID=1872578 RepID=UPI003BAFDD0A